MALFLSCYINKLDRKGRVSVPAPFRTALSAQSFSGIVVYRSYKLPALEACGIDRMEALAERIDSLDQFSDAQDDFAAAILADVRPIPFDGEGRILLPDDLIAHAAIADSVAFAGKGRVFEIWEPKAFQAHQDEARRRIREEKRTLGAQPPERR